MLYSYMRDVQRLLKDQNQEYVNTADIINYVNKSRRMIALRTRCIRILSPVAGQITTANITNPGSGYVTPVATISAPDFPTGLAPSPNGLQATATATQIGGIISNIAITNGGQGYYAPTITLTDAAGHGTGATATVSTTPVMQTQGGQEVYDLASVPIQTFPGVGAPFWVNSISVIFNFYRNSLLRYSFPIYQAKIRNWVRGFEYVPAVFSQLARGTSTTLYMYPVASQPYQMEIDASCLPQDLTDDESEEAIPQPWQDCVMWYAAHLAFLELQNLNAGEYYRKLADERINSFSSWAAPMAVSNPYGRW